MIDQTVAEAWMDEALELARESAAADEVPVGAVVARLKGGVIMGRGRDRKIELRDPTAHAEILACRQAAETLGDWRLEGCALVVTLEPCPMCAGAALLARVPLVIYGASNPKFGAVASRLFMYEGHGWNHAVKTMAGVREADCAHILSEYFSSKRVR